MTVVAAFPEKRGDDVASGVVVLDEEDPEGSRRKEPLPPDHLPLGAPIHRSPRPSAGGAARSPAAVSVRRASLLLVPRPALHRRRRRRRRERRDREKRRFGGGWGEEWKGRDGTGIGRAGEANGGQSVAMPTRSEISSRGATSAGRNQIKRPRSAGPELGHMVAPRATPSSLRSASSPDLKKEKK